MGTQRSNSDDPGIRKAAILLASLDQAAAERMLNALGPEQAKRLRRAVAGLGETDAEERRRVIEEFSRVRPMVPQRHPPGIELGGRSARRSAPSEKSEREAAPAHEPVPSSADARPFRFLQEAEADKLARVLASERPQTMALVLSHLPPERAGYVLARLPGPVQAEVVHRLIDLEETDAEILGEVEQALRSRLSEQVQMQRRRVAGMKAVAEILNASDREVGMQILESLGAHDRRLAERLSPPSFRFDDLEGLDDRALSEVFRAASAELTMTALIGASPRLVEGVLRSLPRSEADSLRYRLNHPGPIRLRDVEQAREQIAALARRLAVEGRIRTARREPLAVS